MGLRPAPCLFFSDRSDSLARGTSIDSLPVMIDTISRVEAWLDAAARRLAARESGQQAKEPRTVKEVVESMNAAAKSGSAPAMTLESALVGHPHLLARLSTDAGIIDRWTAQLMNPGAYSPVMFQQAGDPSARLAASQEAQFRLTEQLLNVYRFANRPRNGIIVDALA